MRDLLSDLDQPMLEEADPVRRSQAAMKRQLPKRFYENATVEAEPEGFVVKLDGKMLKTPGKQDFLVPSEKLARAVAAEWAAQETHVDPGQMPLTRMVNTAIDGVSSNKSGVREEILGFAGSDLLCYRAGSPETLVARQSASWDGYLDWMRQVHGARFALAEGVMHIDQPDETLSIVAGLLAAHDSALMLTGLHVVTSLTGSVVMALAIANGGADPEEVWAAAHVDEDWNIEQWGEDAEARRRRELRKREFDAAVTLIGAMREA